MRRSTLFRAHCLLAAMVSAASLNAWSHGEGESAPPGVEPVISMALQDVAGKHATVVRVTLAPGASADPHRHPGSVIAYVLAGTVESALDDEPPVAYGAGEAWTEYAGAVHRVTRNVGDKPAVLLAVLLHDQGAPLSVPAEADSSQP